MSTSLKIDYANDLTSKFNFFSPPDLSENKRLNPAVDIDSEKSGKSHARKEKMWQVASVVVVIAFLVLSAGAAVATSVFFPAYIPLTALLTLGLLEPVYQIYAKCKMKADQHEGAAKEEFGVAKEIEVLKSKGGQGSLEALREMGISTYQIKDYQHISSLDPIIRLAARYEFWRKREQELNQEVAHLLQEKPENPEVIKSNRVNAYMLKQLAYFSKAKAAYYYGIALDPFQRAQIDEIYSIHSPSLEDRYLEKTYGNTENFLLFKNTQKGSISMEEMNRLTIPDLARKIMSAAPSA